MARAWIVLLAGCGFQSKVQTAEPPTADAAVVDGASTVPCWNLTYQNLEHLSACPASVGDPLHLIADLSINTDGGDSTPSGTRCAALASGTAELCVIAVASLKLDPNVKLSAHGTKALALLAHSIEINGTIDIASHLGGQRGPGSGASGCNTVGTASGGGGGAGGTMSNSGGKGGDQGGVPSNGGHSASSISDTLFRGGCDGGGGADPTGLTAPGVGGHAGGAVWISSDTDPLILGPGAIINASGASGLGGTTLNHGGSGGGSGGVIVLQAASITMHATAAVFANGGHGGGGDQGGVPGTNGLDPSGPTSGGDSGQGGPASGVGGTGYPAAAAQRDGVDGTLTGAGGGGGGGGGAGTIRATTLTNLMGNNVSPAAVKLTP